MRIGVFGGTFDPPHVAHLVLAAEAHHQLSLDRVLWVLTPSPPHKRNQVTAPYQQRLKMLRLSLDGNDTFEMSLVDSNRLPPYYAVDTMALLRAQYPEDELIYLMGEDSLHDIPTWHNPKEFVDSCDELGVMRRKGIHVDLDQLSIQVPGITQKVRCFYTPTIEISSTMIRNKIIHGEHYRYFLHPAVYRWIVRNKLYLTSL